MRQQLPNAITVLRIATVPALVWLARHHSSDAFAVLLVSAMVGDVLDGWLARRLGVSSAIGAILDSTADTLIFLVAAYGAITLHPGAVAAHPIMFAAVPLVWISENLVALARYGRLSSFHTVLSRVAATALGIFVGVLFFRGFNAPAMQLTLALLVLSTAEEFVLLWLLPTWTADVRGVYWVLQRRAARQQNPEAPTC